QRPHLRVPRRREPRRRARGAEGPLRHHIFVRHGTAADLVDERLSGKTQAHPLDRTALLKKVRRMRMWAYVDIPEDDGEEPCVVHFWFRKGHDPSRVALLIGHELGHISGDGPQGPPGDMAEEERAQGYGLVAQEVVAMLEALDLVRETPTKASRRRS